MEEYRNLPINDRLRKRLQYLQKKDRLQILEEQLEIELDRINWKSNIRSRLERGKKLKITKI